MAKAKKTNEVTEEKIESSILEETKIKITDTDTADEIVTEPIYIPDIPAQMIEQPESDEVLFLKRILYIQETGGFGRHLHDLINERIKELKNGN